LTFRPFGGLSTLPAMEAEHRYFEIRSPMSLAARPFREIGRLACA
jgi:hypothetical protein